MTGPAPHEPPNAADRRRSVVRMGGPIFVPAPSLVTDWTVCGVDGAGTERVPVGIMVSGQSGDEHMYVRTTTSDDEDQALYVAVSNVVLASLTQDITLPLTITVTRRTAVGSVDGVPTNFDVVETPESWRARAEVAGRTVEVAALTGVFTPDNLALERMPNIDDLAPS